MCLHICKYIFLQRAYNISSKPEATAAKRSRGAGLTSTVMRRRLLSAGPPCVWLQSAVAWQGGKGMQTQGCHTLHRCIRSPGQTSCPNEVMDAWRRKMERMMRDRIVYGIGCSKSLHSFEKDAFVACGRIKRHELFGAINWNTKVPEDVLVTLHLLMCSKESSPSLQRRHLGS